MIRRAARRLETELRVADETHGGADLMYAVGGIEQVIDSLIDALEAN